VKIWGWRWLADYLSTRGALVDLCWCRLLYEYHEFWRLLERCSSKSEDLTRDKRQKWKCEKRQNEKEKTVKETVWKEMKKEKQRQKRETNWEDLAESWSDVLFLASVSRGNCPQRRLLAPLIQRASGGFGDRVGEFSNII
jgi:hypothetical protein